ncbi:MAG: hypothetical protein JWQ88_3083 [Rhodoferax sp.]|nr:hypothetical protein [Rhodoferax sp.]
MTAALCMGQTAHADDWLTIQGDPTSPTVDTVQVVPDSITVFDDLRTIKIRVSRSASRRAYDGQPYRSYEAVAEIDCEQRLARYRRHTYFVEPLWAGIGRHYTPPEGKLPELAFRSISPNPAQRLIQAACSLHEVKSNR